MAIYGRASNGLCLFREVHKDTGPPKGGPAFQGERRRRDHKKRTGTIELIISMAFWFYRNSAWKLPLDRSNIMASEAAVVPCLDCLMVNRVVFKFRFQL